VVDRTVYPPVQAGVAVIAECRHADPTQFAWRPPPYEYEHHRLAIDILAGSERLRHQIDRGMSARDIAQPWVPEIEEFLKVRKNFLLY
jgi:uncharacterized protein YbbC (DUF1343 family)